MNARRLWPAMLMFGVGACVVSAGGDRDRDGSPGSGGQDSGGVGGQPGAGGAGGKGSGGSGAGGSGAGGSGAGGSGVGGSGGGGSGVGGSGVGGATASGGASGWSTGYTATMFGNTTVGDCAGVANFTDATNISGATCTYQGVTIAPYSSSMPNNASYYGAPGDESSIWQGPACSCQGGAPDTNGKCDQPPACPMEGDCAKCFEIKCDPAGTGTYSDGATRVGAMYCNPNQSAVIEVIDACPHNHKGNPWWCTAQRKNHIDISCSAMKAIAGQPSLVGSWGWLNVQVRPVACSGGLGPKPL
jgi:hypothetical protein